MRLCNVIVMNQLYFVLVYVLKNLVKLLHVALFWHVAKYSKYELVAGNFSFHLKFWFLNSFAKVLLKSQIRNVTFRFVLPFRISRYKKWMIKFGRNCSYSKLLASLHNIILLNLGYIQFFTPRKRAKSFDF